MGFQDVINKLKVRLGILIKTGLVTGQLIDSFINDDAHCWTKGWRNDNLWLYVFYTLVDVTCTLALEDP